MQTPEANVDRPVFTADRSWRKRSVNVGLGLAGGLLLCWLAALVAGALGFGSLPALPFADEGSGTASSLESRPQTIKGTHGAGRPAMAPNVPSAARAGRGSERQIGAASRPAHLADGAAPEPPLAVSHRSPATAGSRPTPAHGVAAAPPPAGTASKGGGAGGTGIAPGAGAPPQRGAGSAPLTTPSGREVPSGGAQGGNRGVSTEARLGLAQEGKR
jgi:hypothetical protein